VISLVFVVISAYKEIPDNQNVISVETSQASPAGTKSEIISEAVPPPPPPPPAQISGTTEPAQTGNKITPSQTGKTKKENAVNVEVVKEEDVTDKSSEPEPFVVVEDMPMFPGGDASLLKYIAEHVNYPQTAKENNIAGRVIVRFCINATGNVERISILKGVDPDLDAEAIRVVGTLPTFQPGRQSGKAVPVWYMVPITFTLK
ncbi:MAG TPA: TonB family protein, partial [Bacteroidales bacterium]|nr:TonB family protein [Bacteroidales bacterium]